MRRELWEAAGFVPQTRCSSSAVVVCLPVSAARRARSAERVHLALCIAALCGAHVCTVVCAPASGCRRCREPCGWARGGGALGSAGLPTLLRPPPGARGELGLHTARATVTALFVLSSFQEMQVY